MDNKRPSTSRTDRRIFMINSLVLGFSVRFYIKNRIITNKIEKNKFLYFDIDYHYFIWYTLNAVKKTSEF